MVRRVMKDAGDISLKKALPEFSECVMYLKTPLHKGREKLEPKWESGVYLGIHEKSQELVIGTPEGAVKAQEFRRKEVTKKDGTLMKLP